MKTLRSEKFLLSWMPVFTFLFKTPGTLSKFSIFTDKAGFLSCNSSQFVNKI